MAAPLPLVLVPAFNAVEALDGCLASLERTLPAGAEVWIADDASSDPQLAPLASGWCRRSRLSARYLRRDYPLGWAGNCNAVFAELRDRDVVVFGAMARATPGWLQQLARCAATDARIATMMPWSNHGEFASFPRGGEYNPLPDFPDAIAEAAAVLDAEHAPELPATLGACLYLRGRAVRELGGFDAGTFGDGPGADCDFSRRAAAMGWRNVLCPRAYVANAGIDAIDARGENLHRLLARWPDFHEAVARFLLADPLRSWRERLAEGLARIERGGPQRDLFG